MLFQGSAQTFNISTGRAAFEIEMVPGKNQNCRSAMIVFQT